MMDIRKLHEKAMALAQRALQPPTPFARKRARDRLKEALRLEVKATHLASDEPTRSVLLRSAASLAIHLNEAEKAERLIADALSRTPRVDIAEELRALLLELYLSGRLRYAEDFPLVKRMQNEAHDIAIQALLTMTFSDLPVLLGANGGRTVQRHMTFAAYAGIVENIVATLGDAYEYYTLLVKSPQYFLNYHVPFGDRKHRTDQQWLEFLKFNRTCIRQERITYRRYFFVCESQDVQQELTVKNPALSTLRDFSEVGHGLWQKVVVQPTDHWLAPVLFCRGKAPGWEPWPRAELTEAKRIVSQPALASPAFLIHESMPSKLPPPYHVRTLAEVVEDFHTEECCYYRKINKRELKEIFQRPDTAGASHRSPRLPLDVFAVRDKHNGRWLLCLGAQPLDVTVHDGALVMIYAPDHPQWSGIAKNLDKLFRPGQPGRMGLLRELAAGARAVS